MSEVIRFPTNDISARIKLSYVLLRVKFEMKQNEKRDHIHFFR